MNNFFFSTRILVVLLLLIPALGSAIDLQVTPTPSTCPLSGRINFSVSGLMPGSPGPLGSPPSVVFEIWSPGGLTIAGAARLTRSAAYLTSDVSIGGLAPGVYHVVAVESFGSATAESPVRIVTVADGFGETPDFSVEVSEVSCRNDGTIAVSVTQGVLTEFELLNAADRSVVRGWQTSSVFRNLPEGTYIVRGRDDCLSHTVKEKGNYTIEKQYQNLLLQTSTVREGCDVRKFRMHVTLRGLGELALPITATYSITKNGSAVVTNATTQMGTGSLISLVHDIPVDDFDQNANYVFTASGIDACGRTFTWGNGYINERIYSPLNVQKGCNEFTIVDENDEIFSWRFTSYPLGFQQPTGSSTSGTMTFNNAPAGDYVVEWTSLCGWKRTVPFTLDANCEENCVLTGFLSSSYVNLSGCDGPGSVVTILDFLETIGNYVHRRHINKVELISAPTGYTTESMPFELSNENLFSEKAGSPKFVLKFPTRVMGNYVVRFYYQPDGCDKVFTHDRTFTVTPVNFEDFRIQFSPSCDITSINYSYRYRPQQAPEEFYVRKAVLERKTTTGWNEIETAPHYHSSGSFNNIEEPGVYRVKVKKTFRSFHPPTDICDGFEYSNELVVTGALFPTFREAFGMVCASNPSRKMVAVNGQSGRPWPEGYKYKVTHFNRTPYGPSVPGYNASYTTYDFRQVFELADGTYTFSLIDICNNEISREVDITHLGLPEVRQFNICEDQRSALVLEVDKFDQIGYAWYKQVGSKDVIGVPGDDVLMSSTNRLEFNPVATSDGGMYYTRVTLPGIACTVADIPYMLELQRLPNPGTTDFPCTSTEGRVLTKDSAPLALSSLLKSPASGGRWTATSTPLSTGWSGGSTFTPALSQDGTYTFTYTVEGASPDACENLLSASVCVKITVKNVPLPVTLIAFSVTENPEKKGSVILRWSTAMEVNTDRFEIERSSDARSWTKIASQPAGRNATITLNYLAEDLSPRKGINYYRLKMIDLAANSQDGSYSYSRMKSIELDGTYVEFVDVYPNPATLSIVVKTENPEHLTRIELISASGLTVRQWTEERLQDVLRLDGIPNGIYIVKLYRKDGQLKTTKLVVGK